MLFLTGAASVNEALGSALGTVASDMTGAVSTVLPIAVPVMGAILVIGFGIKLFKKFSK